MPNQLFGRTLENARNKDKGKEKARMDHHRGYHSCHANFLSINKPSWRKQLPPF